MMQGLETLWLKNAQMEVIIGSLFAAAIAATAWSLTGSVAALSWVAIAQSIYGTRLWLARKLGDQVGRDSGGPAGYRTLQFGLVLSGLLWGLAVAGCLLSEGMTALTGAVLASTVILTLLVLGCYFGSRALVLPFVGAAIVPVAVTGSILLEKATIIAAVASLLFMLFVSLAAKYIDRLATGLAETKTERDEIENMLKNREEEIVRLEVGVKTIKEKQEALAEELNAATTNLAESEGKAEALTSALQRVSPYDSETGLLNADKYVNVLEREWARMRRQELPITVVHMRLDNFDDYADAYGKIAYEAAIRQVAELLRGAGTRPGDVVARIEENKFAILFPEADHKNGEELANTLCKQIRRLNMPNKNAQMHSSVTASFGVASVIPNSDLSIGDFSDRADAALYEAQFQGGDKVVRFRTLETIKLERWNSQHDGELTADSLVRKLAILGYSAQARTYQPGDYHPDRRVQIDMVDAIVQGNLKVSLEGESCVLRPGDCLFVPKGLVTSFEVVGEKPVICLEGMLA